MSFRHVRECMVSALSAALPGKSRLDHTSLPAPLDYLIKQGLLKSKPRGEWASICCPAHKNGAEKNPSLRVNLTDGHYCCMTCGVRGGDIIALHRLITGRGFVEAVHDVGGRLHD
jgi:hypothetical protein